MNLRTELKSISRSGPALLAAVLLFPGLARADEPVIRVVRAATGAPSILRNGGFEEGEGAPADWQRFGRGFRLAPGEGRSGSRAVACESTGQGEWGIGQPLTLNQAAPTPLVVSGWSKAEGVSGSADSGYALYVDIVYVDGSTLWGQTAAFRCGTHDWQRREFAIVPQKPVRSLSLYCLFRGHAGKVWFDDISLRELRSAAGAMLYEGAYVVPPTRVALPGGKPVTTGDGLQLSVDGSGVGSVKLGGQELGSRAPVGFLARDVAADSDFYGFTAGSSPTLGLKVDAKIEGRADHIRISGRLIDARTKDRAVTLVFALPVDASGWSWGQDIRHSHPIQGNDTCASTVAVGCGATGQMSQYPLLPIYSERAGLAVALDMAKPALFRVSYHAGLKQLLIAYDFGLTPEKPDAEFAFVLYRFDPRWGFRAAFEKLTRIFPEQFAVRSRQQGIWMPFTEVSSVRNWRDFGFRYHEGDSDAAFDAANGILAFRYTEPMTWWMPMAKGAPRTEAEALAERDRLAVAPGGRSQMAAISRGAAMFGEDGQPALRFENQPWCDGAVWSLNPCPFLPDAPNAANVYWNDVVKQRQYGPQAKAPLAGEYLDSIEGYVTTDLNYRREHFRASSVPLTFDTGEKRPALYKGLAVAEFTRWMAGDVHGLSKLMFANGVPYRYCFLCPWLDVLGTETDWLRAGRWAPVSEEQMCQWRTMAGGKPYLLLMNTDFDALGPFVERYFQRALAYGMWPSMFSHNAADNPYWRKPAWYERDRPLFVRYIPLIRRIAEAGWQPVTHAHCDNPRIAVERFGPGPDGQVYLTVFNDTDTDQSGTLTVDPAALHLSPTAEARDLLTDLAGQPAGKPIRVNLSPGQVQLLAFSAARRAAAGSLASRRGTMR